MQDGAELVKQMCGNSGIKRIAADFDEIKADNHSATAGDFVKQEYGIVVSEAARHGSASMRAPGRLETVHIQRDVDEFWQGIDNSLTRGRPGFAMCPRSMQVCIEKRADVRRIRDVLSLEVAQASHAHLNQVGCTQSLENVVHY